MPDHKFNDAECPICLDPYDAKTNDDDNNEQYLCCGHKFHLHWYIRINLAFP